MLPDEPLAWSSIAQRLSAIPSAHRTSLAASDAETWTLLQFMQYIATLFWNVNADENEATRELEAELCRMVLDVVGIGASGHCILTNSGSESIYLAALAAKRSAIAGEGRLEIVASSNAHPAILKAAEMLELRVRLTPASAENRASPSHFETALNAQTILLFASSPAWALGISDPIERIGQLAMRHGLQFHVDRCLADIIGSEQGKPVPMGVGSLSIDLHKFAHAPCCLSALCFVNEREAQTLIFSCSDWDGFPYHSARVAGDRPFWPIAGAWAVMRSLGRRGYQRLTLQLRDRQERFAHLLLDSPVRLVARSEVGFIGLAPENRRSRELSQLLLSHGIGNIHCDRLAVVRLRLDPFMSEPAFARLLERFHRVVRAFAP